MLDGARARLRGLVGTIGTASARRPGRVFAGWALLVVAALMLLPQLVGALRMPPLVVSGSQSEIGQRLLSAGFPELGAEQSVYVFHSDHLGSDDPSYQLAVAAGATALREQPGVGSVQIDPPISAGSGDGHTSFAIAGVRGDDHTRLGQLPVQRAAVQRATAEASDGEVTTSPVGLSALADDIIRSDLDSIRQAEIIALPIAALVLLVGLRSVGAAIILMLSGGATVAVAVGILGAHSLLTPVSTTLFAVTLTLGWALSLDYAILIVLRYRRELEATEDRHEALRRACSTAGVTVCFSSLALSLCASAVLIMASPMIAEFFFGVVATAAVAVAAAITLLPALLSSSGRWLDFGRVSGKLRQHDLWTRWTRHLMRRPWPYLAASVLALVVAAVPVGGMRTGLDFDRPSLAGTDVGAGLERIERSALPGMSGVTDVVLPRAPGAPAPAVQPFVAALRADPAVADVSAVDNGRDTAAVLVLPTAPVDSPDTAALVDRIRERARQQLPQPSYVTGPAAMITDLTGEVTAKFPLAVAVVLGISAVFLCAVFRSLLVPLKAIAMNALGVAAALGLLGLVVAGTGGTTNAAVPLAAFVAVFGLSMDYEVFLVRRIQEHYAASGDNTASVAVGVQETGRAITLAAAVMVTLFAGLLAADRAELRQIGFVLATAIALDATVIRLLLVPSAMQLLGDRNWWFPGRRLISRRCPETAEEASGAPERAL